MSSSLLPSGTCIYLWGSCLNHGDFQRSTELSPSFGSKTSFWSLWPTVGTAVQKQLWGGFMVILHEEILTTDWIFKAKSSRSCPAEWLLPFPPLFLASWAFISCVRAVVQIQDGDLFCTSWMFQKALPLYQECFYLFFSWSEMILNKWLILILLSWGWFCWWRATEFLEHLCLFMNHTHRCLQFCVPFHLSVCVWFWEDKTLSEEQAAGFTCFRIIYVFLMAFL